MATGGLIRSTEQGEDVVKKAYDSKGYPNELLFTQGTMCESSRIIEYCDLVVTVLEPYQQQRGSSRSVRILHFARVIVYCMNID